MILFSGLTTVRSQVLEDKPTVVYGQTRRMPIGGISVEGVKNYEDYLLIGISGLSVGDMIYLPEDCAFDASPRVGTEYQRCEER